MLLSSWNASQLVFNVAGHNVSNIFHIWRLKVESRESGGYDSWLLLFSEWVEGMIPGCCCSVSEWRVWFLVAAVQWVSGGYDSWLLLFSEWVEGMIPGCCCSVSEWRVWFLIAAVQWVAQCLLDHAWWILGHHCDFVLSLFDNAQQPLNSSILNPIF